MALEEQFTEKLEAGAPDITYEGNEAQEQQIARKIWDQLPPQARQQFGNFAQFFASGAWKKVLAALQQQQRGPEEIQETETETVRRAPQAGLGAMMPQPRPMAFGGIAGPDGRQAYGLGSVFKKITKPIKKLAKSKIGKAALMYAATAGIGNLAGGLGGAQPWMSGEWLLPGNMATNLIGYNAAGDTGLLGKGILKGGAQKWSLGNISALKALGLGMTAPYAMNALGIGGEEDKFDTDSGKFGFNYQQMIRDIQAAVRTGDQEEVDRILTKYNLSRADIPPLATLQTAAHGGRIRAQEGGLMDLGGMEKDYRQDGGFVPIGGEEKADDVPARLSKNEFVFTADAVRAAGGGDIDQGAEIMENVMKNLEQGGRISEESQGEGARDMFATSERLSEVV